MKKLVSFLIAVTVLVGIGITTYFMITQSRNNEAYNVSVSASSGGSISIKLDDKDYTIAEGKTNTYTVKHKSNMTLTAITLEGYNFNNWTVNNNVYSSDNTIAISITENKIITANFEVKTTNLTITDNDNFTEQLNYSANVNLLTFLNNTYTAPKGYVYSYLYNNQPVTEQTVIDETGTIVRVKTPITYSVIFKLPDGYTFDGTNSTKNVEYNIENITSLQVPTLPVAKNHYTLAWEKTTFTLDDVNVVTTVNGIETPIQYTVTFKDGDTTIATETYSIENKSITEPGFTSVENIEHYQDLSWSAYNLDDLTNLVVTLNKTPVQYTATLILPTECTFKDDATTTKDITYTIEDSVITFPEVTIPEHYSLIWEEYTLTYNSTTVQISATLQETRYEVKFMNGTTQVGETQYYTISSQTVTAPEFTSIEMDNKEFYTLAWAEYDLSTLTDIDVQLIKTAKEYRFVFKLPEGYVFAANNEQTYETIYTIENVSSKSFPELPIAKAHYNLSWEKTTITKEDLIDANNPTEIKAIETTINYTATLNLPEGYTFKDDGTSTKNITYTIADYTITIPEINAVNHYEISWPSYTLSYTSEPVVITATKTAIVYTVTFMHNDEEYSKQTFTVENNNIQEPTNPSTDNIEYLYVWEDYTHELKNYVVNSVKVELTSVHTLNYNFDYGYYTSDLKNYYNKIAYYNNNIYVLNNKNNTIATLTIDELSNNLFYNVQCPDNSYCELTINTKSVTSVEALKTELNSILTSNTKTTITLLYTEGE